MSACLRIWLVTDEKPGHKNQLRGLARSLGDIVPIDISWLATDKLDVHWWQLIDRRKLPAIQQAVAKLNQTTPTEQSANTPPQANPVMPPDLIIGAGHASHKTLLALRKVYGCFTVVLMKPSIPYRFFDAAIVPSHDSPPQKPDILATRGVLNMVTPNDRPRSNDGLILIGGPSKHYDWNTTTVIEQVVSLVKKEDTHWRLTNSRRTPIDFISLLNKSLEHGNLADRVSIAPHDETDAQWLPEQLKIAGKVWVTPDSVSMVYEALTSSAATGLLELKPSRHGRIVKGIEQLIADKQLTTMASWRTSGEMLPPAPNFCEANRAAAWLLDRLEQHKHS